MRNKTIGSLLEAYPFAEGFFTEKNIPVKGKTDKTLRQYIEQLPDSDKIQAEELEKELAAFIEQMESFLSDDDTVSSITVYPGTDKHGKREHFQELTLRAGEITCIVGPTGSGKSRLLADIEWVAQGDTPTERTIHINGQIPDTSWRFATSGKLVAQLSQNMNFVMDLSVEEFIRMHAESRMRAHPEEITQTVIEQANALAGEAFSPSSQITSLSGGQSRALMIADAAILSTSPVIVIDEIENAGIDRQKALQLLLAKEKIVIMATHDPVLALLGTRRVVIGQGGIRHVISTTDSERELLGELQAIDNRIHTLRTQLRNGERLG
ncbi:MAG: ATP-binding cassette domain-containing protein [Spirochaetota bacterium]